MTDRTSPLDSRHRDRDASFTDFGGWAMPVEFDSITDEHLAVREAAGLFDVSHMSQVRVSGPDATRLVHRLTTNDVTAMAPGDAQYAAMTDADGIMIDDVVTYRLPEAEEGTERAENDWTVTPASGPTYVVVANAGHDTETVDRFESYREEWGLTATVENHTEAVGMVALQGPDAPGVASDAASDRLLDCGRFAARATTIAGVDCLAARTGYTGEDGFEVLCAADDVGAVWDPLVSESRPCGLGARDTLRIEAGLLLSGQDFHPEDRPRTPLEAGIRFAVKLDTEFVGRDALEAQAEEGVQRTLVGIRMIDRGIPRTGYPIETTDGVEVGEVTSGSKTPSLDFPAGLGYVPPETAQAGTRVRVMVRGQPKKAKIESLPFVERV